MTFAEKTLKRGIRAKTELEKPGWGGAPPLPLFSLEFSHQSSPQSRGLTCQGLLIAPGNIIDLDLLRLLSPLRSVSLLCCLRIPLVSCLDPLQDTAAQRGGFNTVSSLTMHLAWVFFSLQLQSSTSHTHTLSLPRHTCSLGERKRTLHYGVIEALCWCPLLKFQLLECFGEKKNLFKGANISRLIGF